MTHALTEPLIAAPHWPEDAAPTDRERALLLWMYDHAQERGMPSTFRECMLALGSTSPQGVQRLVARLCEKGLLHSPEHHLARTALRPRGYVLTLPCGVRTFLSEAEAAALLARLPAAAP